VLDRGIAWWSSRERLMRVVRVEGWEHYRACAGRPVLLLESSVRLVRWDSAVLRAFNQR
jgi:hypothetical protein